MKKIGMFLTIFLLIIMIFLLGFKYESNKYPFLHYQVYLDDELIGNIESKSELEKYINNQGKKIKRNVKEYSNKLESIKTFEDLLTKIPSGILTKKEKAQYLLSNTTSLKLNDTMVENLNFYLKEKIYNYTNSEIREITDYINSNQIYLLVDNIYIPNGIEIKKVYTYDKEILSKEEIYKKIISKKSCTIAGYTFTIKSTIDGVEDIVIYTTDIDVFNKAIENVITIFVDAEEYNSYKNNKQEEITTTGSIIENIYVEQEITYKATNISIEEEVYTDANQLAAYLLYGEGFSQKIVKVASGDTIESISFDNKISVQEFLIFNEQYTNRDNLLVPGTEVTISKIDPKIQIVVEEYEIVDKATEYAVVEQYDESLSRGSVIVTQQGQNGIERVSQSVKSINGEISFVEPSSKETIKSSISKIITIGTKYIATVGSTASWGWPTNSGYTLSSYYGYRISVFGEGNFHSGIDIAGTGNGSNVYAANNGVIETMTYTYSYGNYILINHNNGYYTLYAHMSGFSNGISEGSTVSRGQVIGYVGSTGWATGPHLHFEIRTCSSYSCISNPLSFYR